MSGRGLGKKGLGAGGAVRHGKVLKDTIHGIRRQAIRRMCRRGGVKRISLLMYEEVRRVLKTFLENVLRDAITYTEHARRKTVVSLDVVYALKRSGVTLYGVEEGRRRRRHAAGRHVAASVGGANSAPAPSPSARSPPSPAPSAGRANSGPPPSPAPSAGRANSGPAPSAAPPNNPPQPRAANAPAGVVMGHVLYAQRENTLAGGECLFSSLYRAAQHNEDRRLLTDICAALGMRRDPGELTFISVLRNKLAACLESDELTDADSGLHVASTFYHNAVRMGRAAYKEFCVDRDAGDAVKQISYEWLKSKGFAAWSAKVAGRMRETGCWSGQLEVALLQAFLRRCNVALSVRAVPPPGALLRRDRTLYLLLEDGHYEWLYIVWRESPAGRSHGAVQRSQVGRVDMDDPLLSAVFRAAQAEGVLGDICSGIGVPATSSERAFIEALRARLAIALILDELAVGDIGDRSRGAWEGRTRLLSPALRLDRPLASSFHAALKALSYQNYLNYLLEDGSAAVRRYNLGDHEHLQSSSFPEWSHRVAAGLSVYGAATGELEVIMLRALLLRHCNVQLQYPTTRPPSGMLPRNRTLHITRTGWLRIDWVA